MLWTQNCLNTFIYICESWLSNLDVRSFGKLDKFICECCSTALELKISDTEMQTARDKCPYLKTLLSCVQSIPISAVNFKQDSILIYCFDFYYFENIFIKILFEIKYFQGNFYSMCLFLKSKYKHLIIQYIFDF